MATTAALPLPTHPRLQPATVPPGPRRPPRPRLHVLEGGQAPASRARRAAYRRRRLGAVLLLAAVVLAGALVVGAAAGALTGGTSPAAGSSGSPVGGSSPAGHEGATRIVQPGDTLWSIAEAVAPGVDVRITVDRLVALNGSAPLTAGQRLLLP